MFTNHVRNMATGSAGMRLLLRSRLASFADLRVDLGSTSLTAGWLGPDDCPFLGLGTAFIVGRRALSVSTKWVPRACTGAVCSLTCVCFVLQLQRLLVGTLTDC